jgi:hypothetical protein
MTPPNISEFPDDLEGRQQYLAALDHQRSQLEPDSLEYQQATRAIDRGYERLRRENLPDISNESKYPNHFGLKGDLLNQTRQESISIADGRIWNAIQGSASVEKMNLNHLWHKSKSGISQDVQENALNLKKRKIDGSSKKVVAEESIDLPIGEDGLTRLDSLAGNSPEIPDEFYSDLESVFGAVVMKSRPDISLFRIWCMFYAGYNQQGIIDTLDISRDELRRFLGNKKNKAFMRKYREYLVPSLFFLLCGCAVFSSITFDMCLG